VAVAVITASFAIASSRSGSDDGGDFTLPAGCDALVGPLRAPSEPADEPDRDPADWPFSVDSPWNTPIGSGAQYAGDDASTTASLVREDINAWINAGQNSHPILRAAADDPIVTVWRDDCPVGRFHAPEDAKPAAGDDGHIYVIDPSHRWVDEVWRAEVDGRRWDVLHYVRTDLRSKGVLEGGVRAYGGSGIGGLILPWEAEAKEIRHVLAIALDPAQMRLGPVWPANTQDQDAEGLYKGNVPMGTLVAIPASVDLDALDLSDEGMAVARALQDFGAYVVDRSGCTCLYAEPRLEPTRSLARMRAAFRELRPLLRVVVNNDVRNPGGPGTRRAEEAPTFAS
jgi:hypothetical protein